MNSQYPIPNSSYPLNPNQNPNPNPNFPNSQFNWPPPPQFPPQQPPPPPQSQSQNPLHNFPNSQFNQLNANPNFPNPQFNFPPPQQPPQSQVQNPPTTFINSFNNPLNPNLNFYNPQFNVVPPSSNQTQSENPPPDLANTLSSLKTLIETCTSTLNSLSTILPSLSLSPSSNSLIQCPFNPHHRVPATSLFRHYLNCPSPLDIGPVIETLQYRKTLKNDQNLVKDNKFVQTLDDPKSELCFSIDDYVDLDCNFFYKDCPGVVSLSNSDASKRMFTIPGVLSVECANFVDSSDKGSVEFGGSRVKFLPSEIWFVGCDVEKWSDYPNEYLLSVCKAILSVECVRECELCKWVIENSPRFGIVIDVAMRDHLCVLFRLCLKALVRESACSYESFKNRIDDESKTCNPRSMSFKCPVLVEVLRWLTSQLTILYGESNSRSLVIAMLRHLLYKAASDASLFPVERKLDGVSGNEKGTEVSDNEQNYCSSEIILNRPIFVYQIAAAIAALHERSSLEERIRALRNPPRLAPYQRVAEYSHFTKKADEERQKRPDYKALIEHDGFLNLGRHDQGGNKPKTTEELLAEERDYKRRRMSYRGKKLKRSANEVMRDIIEKYMETIMHVGGIGGPEKGGSENTVLISANSSDLHAKSSKLNYDSRTDMQDDSRVERHKKELLDNDYKYHDTKSVNPSKRVERHKQESYNHEYSDDRRRTSRDRHDRDRRDRDYDSRSPSRDRKHSRSTKSRSHSSRNQVDENERLKVNYSSHRSSSLKTSSGRKDKRKLDSPDRHRRKSHKHGRSDSFESVEVNDRYDPSEAGHSYDDELDNNDYRRSTS